MKSIFLLGLINCLLLSSCSLFVNWENVRWKDVDVSLNSWKIIEINWWTLEDLWDYKIYNFEDNKKCELYAFKNWLCPKWWFKITWYDNNKEAFCHITWGEVIAWIDKCTFNWEEKVLDQFYTEYIKEKYNKIVWIYFDKNDKNWKDEYWVCHTCTPENGFSIDWKMFDSWIKNSENVWECKDSWELNQCKISIEKDLPPKELK